MAIWNFLSANSSDDDETVNRCIDNPNLSDDDVMQVLRCAKSKKRIFRLAIKRAHKLRSAQHFSQIFIEYIAYKKFNLELEEDIAFAFLPLMKEESDSLLRTAFENLVLAMKVHDVAAMHSIHSKSMKKKKEKDDTVGITLLECVIKLAIENQDWHSLSIFVSVFSKSWPVHNHKKVIQFLIFKLLREEIPSKVGVKIVCKTIVDLIDHNKYRYTKTGKEHWEHEDG